MIDASNFPAKCTKCTDKPFIFNDRRGLAWHFKNKHNILSDYGQYLEPIILNDEDPEQDQPETNPQSDPNNDIIQKELGKNTANLGLNKQLAIIHEVSSFRKQLAMDKYIEAMFKKLTRDLDNDIDEMMQDPINPEQIKQDCLNAMQQQQAITGQVQEIPKDPTQNELTQQFINLAMPYLPKIIEVFGKLLAQDSGKGSVNF